MVTFLYPALLAALLALPLLWYLLRVTPPPPKRIFFPATRFLAGLIPQDHTPSKTPWWILLLRLLMAALIIVALARPVINPADTLAGSGPVRIIIDNSWPSAQVWDLQIAEAKELIAQAGREKREIYILTTAPIIGENKPFYQGPMSQGEASSILRGLKPLPWPADYKATQDLIANQKSLLSFWLSHGLDEGSLIPLVRELQKQGGLEFVAPATEKLPLLLRPSKIRAKTKTEQDTKANVHIDIDGPKTLPENLTLSVQAQGQNGQILDLQSATLQPSALPHTVSFDIMENLKGDLAQFRISGRKGAGAIYLLDDQSKKRDIGIVGSAEQSESAPLIDDSYYIKRALEPYANITIGNVADLVDKNLPMIILPDVSAMPAETLNALEKWVKDGGLLLRFSGPNMAQSQSEQFLLPVTLRSGGRSLAGAMTWEKPQTLLPFRENSPFFGLEIPEDLTVKQQILADPAQDLTDKVWGQLSDGTPLMTGAPLEKGLIVLIHTTAGPEWSDLPLSGLYVNMLRRITVLAGTQFTAKTLQNNVSLEPVLMLDGFGTLIPPASSTLPLPAKDVEKTLPSAIHPPGLYGHEGTQFALNIGTALPELSPVGSLPAGIKKRSYEMEYEFDLMPSLLTCALALFFIDWLAMMIFTGSVRRLLPRRMIKAGMIAFLLILPCTVHAKSERDIQFANGLYLAYIKTGDTMIDDLSQTGLENLSTVLKQRTSVEPEGVAALDPENDNLAFFPIIYWPVIETQKPISDKALKNIQFYLDHGGTILFDTRDQNRSTSGLVSTSGTQDLRIVTGSLNIPPLNPIQDDHVLGRSFYLLRNYPGRFEHGTLWVEEDGANGRDGVSSVLIGSNDWAGAWAAFSERTNRYNPTRNSSQQEMAMRFGVNLVMYALTGNYKADQVHIPFILERLGK